MVPIDYWMNARQCSALKENPELALQVLSLFVDYIRVCEAARKNLDAGLINLKLPGLDILTNNGEKEI